MAIMRGSSYTPDKKNLLIEEIRDELSKIDMLLRKDGFVKSIIVDLQKVKFDLVSKLESLIQKKGVVTPQETDAILDSITIAKKTRLYNDSGNKFNASLTTFVLVVLVGYAIFHISKGKYE
jgi:hypothetical protein